MADVTLDARPRKLFGKRCRYLRRAGITPANLYGAGIDSVAVQVDSKAVAEVVRTTSRNVPVQVAIRGEKQPRTAFIWGIQRHPLSDSIVHVDLYHVDVTHRMRATVPLVFVNIDPGLAKLDRRVVHMLGSVEVECLPLDLPTEFRVDCSGLQYLDDELKVGVLAAGAAVEVLADPEAVVARVTLVAQPTEAEAGELAGEGVAAPAKAEPEAADEEPG